MFSLMLSSRKSSKFVSKAGNFCGSAKMLKQIYPMMLDSKAVLLFNCPKCCNFICKDIFSRVCITRTLSISRIISIACNDCVPGRA